MAGPVPGHLGWKSTALQYIEITGTRPVMTWQYGRSNQPTLLHGRMNEALEERMRLERT
jgi:hypothetical protein